MIGVVRRMNLLRMDKICTETSVSYIISH